MININRTLSSRRSLAVAVAVAFGRVKGAQQVRRDLLELQNVWKQIVEHGVAQQAMTSLVIRRQVRRNKRNATLDLTSGSTK